MRYASIDIGTNTLLMLVAESSDGQNFTVCEDHHSIVRLGEGLDARGSISDEALIRACSCLSEYRDRCRTLGVDRIRAISTSAVRRAKNQTEVLDRLSQALGHNVECISGDDEARMTFMGAEQRGEVCTVIDIGGGSTELVCGKDHELYDRVSLEMGAVRLKEMFFLHGLPSAAQVTAAAQYVDKVLAENTQHLAGMAIGVAGTPTTLASMAQGLLHFEESRIEGYVLSYDLVYNLSSRLLELSVEQIVALPGVHPKRADILASGALILKRIMAHYRFTSLRVSTRGLRYGVMKDMMHRP